MIDRLIGIFYEDSDLLPGMYHVEEFHVQPMSRPVGTMFYQEFQYGRAIADRTVTRADLIFGEPRIALGNEEEIQRDNSRRD